MGAKKKKKIQDAQCYNKNQKRRIILPATQDGGGKKVKKRFANNLRLERQESEETFCPASYNKSQKRRTPKAGKARYNKRRKQRIKSALDGDLVAKVVQKLREKNLSGARLFCCLLNL